MRAVVINALTTSMVLIAKLIIIYSGSVDLDFNLNGTRSVKVRSLGFYFNYQGGLDIQKSIQGDMNSLVLLLFYFGFVMNLIKAKYGKIKIHRTLTTITNAKPVQRNLTKGSFY